jgi:hypothetical protein
MDRSDKEDVDFFVDNLETNLLNNLDDAHKAIRLRPGTSLPAPLDRP